jgi:hypothetical protein
MVIMTVGARPSRTRMVSRIVLLAPLVAFAVSAPTGQRRSVPVTQLHLVWEMPNLEHMIYDGGHRRREILLTPAMPASMVVDADWEVDHARLIRARTDHRGALGAGGA